jgi:hypothetical protein
MAIQRADGTRHTAHDTGDAEDMDGEEMDGTRHTAHDTGDAEDMDGEEMDGTRRTGVMDGANVRGDQMYSRFARVLSICTWAGLGVVIVFGGLYLLGFGSSVEVHRVIEYWDRPVSRFWQSVRGSPVTDYSWFLSNLRGMDSISVLGVVLLAFAPLIALLVTLWRFGKPLRLFLIILAAEFIFSMVRPYL